MTAFSLAHPKELDEREHTLYPLHGCCFGSMNRWPLPDSLPSNEEIAVPKTRPRTRRDAMNGQISPVGYECRHVRAIHDKLAEPPQAAWNSRSQVSTELR